eukprot:TRINITY_DN28134_c0_g1_i1.p1 TRINITY_DN28134_c0_g1~~TRINITY_DN28134_c0_g1_i1.p1  ORF type:complete len:411 (+),score=32.66 TRINITY_DN28134_c0_g1_i1:1661-2893(+)
MLGIRRFKYPQCYKLINNAVGYCQPGELINNCNNDTCNNLQVAYINQLRKLEFSSLKQLSRMMCVQAIQQIQEIGTFTDGSTESSNQNLGNFNPVQTSETINISDLMKQAGIKNDEKLVLRLLLQHRQVGELLGEGGQNLKNIQEQNQCVIRFSDSNNRYPGNFRRVMEIRGNALNLFTVLQHMLPVLHLVQQKFAIPTKNGDDDDDFHSKFGEKFLIMTFFNVELTGSIIGKDGLTVKEIKTKANVDVEAEYGENVIPGCFNRLLWIRGDPDNILHALIQISGIIHETESYKRFCNTDLLEYTELGWFPQFLHQLRKYEFFKSEEVVFKLSVEKKYIKKIEEKIEEIAKVTYCDISIQQKGATDLVVIKGAFLNSMRAKALVAQKIKQQRVRKGQSPIREGLQRSKDIR